MEIVRLKALTACFQAFVKGQSVLNSSNLAGGQAQHYLMR